LDEIQQKIEDFQSQLIPRQTLLKQTLLSCPAVLPAVGLITGLVLQFYFVLSLSLWFVILILCAILYLIWRLFSTSSIYFLFIVIFLCFTCLGSIRLTAYNMPASNDIRNIMIDDFTFAHIKAQIISKPRIVVADENDWLFSKFSQSLPYTTFYAKVTDIKTTAGWKKAAGTIKFYISEDANYLKTGDEFQSFCRLRNFSPPDNPGQFNIVRYMNSNAVYIAASVKSTNAITFLNIENKNPKSLLDLKAKLRQLAITALHGDAQQQNNDTRLVEALLLGSRAKIDRKLYNDFIKTGLVHLICLSGLHVGIIAGFAWWLAKKAGLLHRGRAIACIIVTIIFLLVVPATSPTLRAGIMFIVFCLAYLFNRRSKLLNSIAVSAIFLLLIRPMDFLDAGFQLSFAATIGIVLLCPLFFNFLISPFGYLKKTYLYKILQILLAAFSTSCTASLAVMPLIAWHFYRFQPLTAIWTVLASLPVTIIIILGTLKIMFTPLLPTLAAGIAIVIDFSAWVLSELVTIFAKVPFTQVTTGKVSIYIVLLLYLLLFLWRFFSFHRKPAANYIYPAMIVFLLIAAFSINKFKNLNNLQLTVLSIGHGQAAVIQLPGGQNIIIDAGSMSRNNIGTKIVNPFLDYTAAGQIDSVFISHDDIDHYNGIPEILEKHKCNNIYTTGQFISSGSYTAAILNKFLKEHKLSLEITPEKIMLDKTTITRLWPKETSTEIPLSDNESSLVLLFEYAGRKIIFCSDITKDIQNQLANLYPALDVDIMITPHHGSGRTFNPFFLNAFKPEYLITSCSESRFQTISSEIRKFAQSLYTCKDGATAAAINSKGKIKIETFK